MNKYKNKTLYRLIPIKVTELLFFCQEYGVIFSGFVFCCFNIKNNDMVQVQVSRAARMSFTIQTNQIYNIIYSLNIMISKRLHLFKYINNSTHH